MGVAVVMEQETSATTLDVHLEAGYIGYTSRHLFDLLCFGLMLFDASNTRQ